MTSIAPYHQALVGLADDEEVDLLEAMLLLCVAHDQSTDTEHCRDMLDDIADRLRSEVIAVEGEERVERFVAGMREIGFRGNADHYYDERNSLLSEVLERRTGIPISLAVVFMEVGARLGIELRGVNLPFHFLLKAIDLPDLFVDPFFTTTRDTASCAQLLAEVSGGTVGFQDQHLRTVDARQVFVRVLRNLKTLRKQAGAMDDALELCELILSFDPEQPGEYRDRGTICLARGEWNRAIDDLSTYLAMTPAAPDRSIVLGQLQWVLHQQSSVH